MRLLLINLERSPDRLATMRTRLDAIGQPFEVLPATDGRALGPAERALVDAGRRRRFSRHQLGDNEIGCWLSHLRALRALLDGPDPMLAVLEDDVTPDPELPLVLRALELMGPAFDMVTLHRHPGRREFFAPCAPLLPGWEIGRVGYTQIGTQGYVVSRAGAGRILAAGERLVNTYDNYLQRVWANRLDIYGLSRAAVLPDEAAASTIGESRAARLPLPGAGGPAWEAARRLTRVADSVAKRAWFPLAVRRGRRRLLGRPAGPA